jgi:hypothetical protein
MDKDGSIMRRREIGVKLNDGKSYQFSERNRSDSNYGELQERIRKYKVAFIQENIRDKEDRLSMLLAEIGRVYSAPQVAVFVNGNYDEKLRIVYDSFKVRNEGISFEEFRGLMKGVDLEEVKELITGLEEEDEAGEEKKKEGNQ